MTSIYCSVDNVRSLTGLTDSQMSDAVISGIIQHGTSQLNSDIQIKWEDERVSQISCEKENKVDGSNTVFYTRKYPLGDRNNDGIINGDDVYVYTLDSDSVRAQVTVSTIDDSDIGKITLASAPASDEALYFTYYSSPVNMEEPHNLINLACIQLSAALCFTRLDVTKVQSFRVGKVAVMKQSQAFDIYRRQYFDTINRIRSKIFKVMRGTKTL